MAPRRRPPPQTGSTPRPAPPASRQPPCTFTTASSGTPWPPGSTGPPPGRAGLAARGPGPRRRRRGPERRRRVTPRLTECHVLDNGPLSLLRASVRRCRPRVSVHFAAGDKLRESSAIMRQSSTGAAETAWHREIGIRVLGGDLPVTAVCAGRRRLAPRPEGGSGHRRPARRPGGRKPGSARARRSAAGHQPSGRRAAAGPAARRDRGRSAGAPEQERGGADGPDQLVGIGVGQRGEPRRAVS